MGHLTKDQLGDREQAILALLEESSEWTQRDIARMVELSLGTTNGVLRRLEARGFISFRRIDANHVRYSITGAGREHLRKGSYHSFVRRMSGLRRYRSAVDELVRRASENGYGAIVLVGHSDLSFVVRDSCGNHGLALDESGKLVDPCDDVLVLLGEHADSRSCERVKQHGCDSIELWPLLDRVTRTIEREDYDSDE